VQCHWSVASAFLVQCHAVWETRLVFGVADALGGLGGGVFFVQLGVLWTQRHHVDGSVNHVALARICHALAICVMIKRGRARTALFGHVKNLRREANGLHRNPEVAASEQLPCGVPLKEKWNLGVGFLQLVLGVEKGREQGHTAHDGHALAARTIDTLAAENAGARVAVFVCFEEGRRKVHSRNAVGNIDGESECIWHVGWRHVVVFVAVNYSIAIGDGE